MECGFATFTTKTRQLIRVHARLWYTVGHGIAMGVHDLGVAIRVSNTSICTLLVDISDGDLIITITIIGCNN